jgi:hypothetical protein
MSVEELIGHLGLLDSDVDQWLVRDNPETYRDHMGRISVPKELLDRYSNSAEYTPAFQKAVRAEKAQREADERCRNERFQKERLELLDIYDLYVCDLESMHRKYLDTANLAGYESSAMAAYLLISKAISILKMGCLCLRSGYWYSGSLLREVDESLDVAQYFVLTKGTSDGEKALRRWFRQNHAPKHEVCRREIAIGIASVIRDIDKQQHQELLNELYQKKSKWTHPAYGAIREVTRFNLDGATSVEDVVYGPCNFERKLLELTQFFRSSIWTSFQVFLTCFRTELPLTQKDIDYLLKYDKSFQEQTTGERPQF